eukprot:15477278-Alexandrium_andersonii.AAC.1
MKPSSPAAPPVFMADTAFRSSILLGAPPSHSCRNWLRRTTVPHTLAATCPLPSHTRPKCRATLPAQPPGP